MWSTDSEALSHRHDVVDIDWSRGYYPASSVDYITATELLTIVRPVES